MKSDALTKFLLAVIAICMCAIVVRVWLPPSTQPGEPKFDHVQMTLAPLGVGTIFFDQRTGDMWLHTTSLDGKESIQRARIESLDKPIQKMP